MEPTTEKINTVVEMDLYLKGIDYNELDCLAEGLLDQCISNEYFEALFTQNLCQSLGLKLPILTNENYEQISNELLNDVENALSTMESSFSTDVAMEGFWTTFVKKAIRTAEFMDRWGARSRARMAKAIKISDTAAKAIGKPVLEKGSKLVLHKPTAIALAVGTAAGLFYLYKAFYRTAHYYHGLANKTELYIHDAKQHLFDHPEKIDDAKIKASQIPKSSLFGIRPGDELLTLNRRSIMLSQIEATRLLEGLIALNKDLIATSTPLIDLQLDPVVDTLQGKMYRRVTENIKITSSIPKNVLLPYGTYYGDVGWNLQSISDFCGKVLELTAASRFLKKYLANIEVANDEIEKVKMDEHIPNMSVMEYEKIQVDIKNSKAIIRSKVKFLISISKVYIEECQRLFWIAHQLIELVNQSTEGHPMNNVTH